MANTTKGNSYNHPPRSQTVRPLCPVCYVRVGDMGMAKHINSNACLRVK
jgi:hypothetical protein